MRAKLRDWLHHSSFDQHESLPARACLHLCSTSCRCGCTQPGVRSSTPAHLDLFTCARTLLHWASIRTWCVLMAVGKLTARMKDEGETESRRFWRPQNEEVHRGVLAETGNVLQSAKLLKCDSFCFSRTETLSCTGMLGMHSCSHTQTRHIFMRTLAYNNTFPSSIRWTLKTTFYMTYDPLRHPVLKVTKALNQQSSQRQECKHTHTQIDRSQRPVVMTCSN